MGVHDPIIKWFDDYKQGDVVPAPSRTVTEADVVTFAAFSGDWHSLHTDDLFAKQSQFGSRIVHGMATIAIMSGLMFRAGLASDAAMGFLGINNWAFKAPVYMGDTITAHIEVKEARVSRSKPDRGIITFHIQIVNKTRKNEVSSEGDWSQMYSRGPYAPKE